MNLIIYLVAAAVIGWVATTIMHDRSNLLINIIVAVLVIPGWRLPEPHFQGWDDHRCYHYSNQMLLALLGAVILLAIVNLFRRRR